MSQIKMLVDAYDSFIKGCKDDGIWSSMKAACIMAGWDGLDGALTPLVGSAPTNNNFVSGDYNRETGLLGNGTTKYLNSNRAGNADPQNDAHISIYMSQVPPSGVRVPIGLNDGSIRSNLVWNSGGAAFYPRINNNTASMANQAGATTNGFYGATRSSSASYEYLRASDASTTSLLIASGTPPSLNHYVMAWNDNGSANYISTGRIAFYSIGESTNLVTLRSRANTLIADIAAAIP